MEAFDIEVTLGQRPNFDSMCGVPVDILDMIFDSTDSVDTDDDLFL